MVFSKWETRIWNMSTLFKYDSFCSHIQFFFDFDSWRQENLLYNFDNWNDKVCLSTRGLYEVWSSEASSIVFVIPSTSYSVEGPWFSMYKVLIAYIKGVPLAQLYYLGWNHKLFISSISFLTGCLQPISLHRNVASLAILYNIFSCWLPYWSC